MNTSERSDVVDLLGWSSVTLCVELLVVFWADMDGSTLLCIFIGGIRDMLFGWAGGTSKFL